MEQKTYRVYICTGPNCGPKGSALLVGILEREIEQLKLQDRVSVAAGGCQNHCETGPSMVVYPGGIFYRHIDGQRLQRIARDHLANGTPVAEYLWTNPSQTYSRKEPHPSRPTIDENPFVGQGDRAGARPPKKQRKSYDVDDFKW